MKLIKEKTEKKTRLYISKRQKNNLWGPICIRRTGSINRSCNHNLLYPISKNINSNSAKKHIKSALAGFYLF
jgi:hypothetical protein